ncbi:hypothetical protein Pint_11358 [Pistacia integerrima]|uniref:Uncharacterized protein n=1 Tax=Pistacia integerrima TaxID=434235 RepID=A0ACC0XFN3_9ROSI|nr:hypothetical protein Pint_11358 [Pistacia integerrima]
MALSVWDHYTDLQHYFNPEMLSFQHQAAGEFEDDFDYYFNLFSFSNNDFGFDYDYVSDTLSDHSYNQFPLLLNDDNQVFNTSESDHQYFSSSSLPDNFIFPLEDFECHHNYPKRQKSYYGDGVDVDHHSVTFSPEFFSGRVSNVINPPAPPPLPEFLPEIIPAPPLAGFSFEKSGSTDHESSIKKPTGVSLSAQSIAARQRRRKITEKTQELGKLIPGGHRMNTAEMFQAASKYVKFLQAQVKVLQLMEPIMQEREELLPSQELQTLLESPIIQEKLYSEEKCLVRREILQTLKDGPEIQSKSAIFETIDELLETNNG